MSGITLILHPSWLEGDMAEVYRKMKTQGVSLFVCKDIRLRPVPLDEWLAGKRQTAPVLDKAPAIALEPPASPPNRPYYQRGRW